MKDKLQLLSNFAMTLNDAMSYIGYIRATLTYDEMKEMLEATRYINLAMEKVQYVIKDNIDRIEENLPFKTENNEKLL